MSDINLNDYTVNKIEEIIQLLMHQNELMEKQTAMMTKMMADKEDGGGCCGG